jgi:hypothetical protein
MHCSTRLTSISVESQRARFNALMMVRPSLVPGRYFQLLLVGYFEAGYGAMPRHVLSETAAVPTRQPKRPASLLHNFGVS